MLLVSQLVAPLLVSLLLFLRFFQHLAHNSGGRVWGSHSSVVPEYQIQQANRPLRWLPLYNVLSQFYPLEHDCVSIVWPTSKAA